MSVRCFIQIKTKRFVQEPSEMTKGLEDPFSKYMDSFVCDLPARMLEQKKRLNLPDSLASVNDFAIELNDGRIIHGMSTIADVHVSVSVELASNGVIALGLTESTIRGFVQHHFAPGNFDNFTVEAFVVAKMIH